MKNILTLNLLLLLLPISVLAQENGFIALSYSMGFTSGETKDFIDEGSFRGFEFSYRRMLTSKPISFGINSGYNNFYQNKGYNSFESNNVILSGNTYNYIHIVPILATSYYYFGQEGGIRPYAGLGIGTYYFYKENLVGSISATTRDWYFGLAPEIGALVPLGESGLNFIANAKYNYAVDEEFWGINVGLAFGM